MISEEYDVIPANNSCSTIINKQMIVPTPGTPTNSSLTNAQALNIQQQENSKYDTIGNLDVKPMYGGNFKKYEIIFKNKKYIVVANNYDTAISTFLKSNNKNYKKDLLLEIKEFKNSFNKNINYNLYVIKGNQNNKNNHFKKQY